MVQKLIWFLNRLQKGFHRDRDWTFWDYPIIDLNTFGPGSMRRKENQLGSFQKVVSGVFLKTVWPEKLFPNAHLEALLYPSAHTPDNSLLHPILRPRAGCVHDYD